jgi:dihydroorotase
VEIDSAVVDGAQSVILPQVTFGIAVRMAVMGIVAGNGERQHEDTDQERPRDRPGQRASTRSPTWPSPRPHHCHRQGQPATFAQQDHRRHAAASWLPGLVDLAARLREPGHEHEGMLESEMAAAVAGGVTSLVCPPDTDPVLDEPGLVEMLKFRAEKLHQARVFPLGALTRGLQGEVLTEMAELTEAGCVGFSQAEVPLAQHPGAAARAAIRQHLWLHGLAAPAGAVTWARACGQRRRWPRAGPERRAGGGRDDCAAHHLRAGALHRRARAPVPHQQRSRRGLVRQAKDEGLPVTCDVSINSLHLTDTDIGYFDSRMRLTRPCASSATATPCVKAWPTAPSTRWCQRPHAGG